MYVIVISGGRVGYYLSKALLNEGHEVLLIEKDATLCERIEDELGSICMPGDGSEVATLDKAGTGRAQLFITVTGEDEDNLVACQIAKHKFNVPRVIARVNNPRNEALFKKLGIDVIVSATDIILEHIEEEVPTHPLIHLLDLQRGNLEIVEVKIPPTSPAVGKSVKELSLPAGSMLSLIVKEQGVQVPLSDTILDAEDRVIAVTKPDTEKALRAVLTGS
jgi:trk/ktr system potassium uptake protein